MSSMSHVNSEAITIFSDIIFFKKLLFCFRSVSVVILFSFPHNQLILTTL